MDTPEAALAALLQASLSYILAFAFGFARIAAALQIIPLFTTINLRGGIRATFAITLTLPLLPVLEPQIRALEEPTVLTLSLIGAKELAVGVLIGTLLAIPFWGVQAAGDIVDFSRGASAANLADPVNASEISVLGTVLLYAALAIFVVVGGVLAVIDVIYESYRVIGVTAVLPTFGPELFDALGAIFTRLLMLGVLISGPMMLAMILIDVGLVFSSRIARQIQTMEFAAILKGLAVALFVPLYAVFLEQYVMTDWRELLSFVRDVLRISGDGG